MTPHYDGVIASAAEPAVVAISGMAPVHVKLVDPACQDGGGSKCRSAA